MTADSSGPMVNDAVPSARTHAAAGRPERPRRRSLQFGLVVAAGIALRLVYVYPPWFASHADCATTGICALTILKGHPRVFYSGVRLGAFESYLTAMGFAIFGVSDWALASGSLLANALTLVVFGLFARETLEPRTSLFALLFLAIPSPSYMFWTSLPFSWAETMLFSAAVLWLAARMVRSGEAGSSAFGFGLAAGLAWWNCILTIAVSVPALVWIIARRPRLFRSRRFLGLSFAGLVLGALPWITFNVRYRLVSFRGNFAVTQAVDPGANTRSFFVYKLPELTVALDPTDSGPPRLPSVGAARVALAVVYLLATIAFVARLWARPKPGQRGERAANFAPEAVLFGVVAATALLNIFSGAGSVRGLMVRYALPVYFAVVVALARLCRPAARRARIFGLAAAIIVISLNLASYPWPGTTWRRDWLRRQDEGHRLAAFLDQRNIRYVVGDFWDSYPVNYFSKLEVKGITSVPGQDVYHLLHSLPQRPLPLALVAQDLTQLREVASLAGFAGRIYEIGPTSFTFIPSPNPPRRGLPRTIVQSVREALRAAGPRL